MRKHYKVTGTIRWVHWKFREKYFPIEDFARADTPGEAREMIEQRLNIEQREPSQCERTWLTEPRVVESSVVPQMRVRGEPMLWDLLAEWAGDRDAPIVSSHPR